MAAGLSLFGVAHSESFSMVDVTLTRSRSIIQSMFYVRTLTAVSQTKDSRVRVRVLLVVNQYLPSETGLRITWSLTTQQLLLYGLKEFASGQIHDIEFKFKCFLNKELLNNKLVVRADFFSTSIRSEGTRTHRSTTSLCQEILSSSPIVLHVFDRNAP